MKVLFLPKYDRHGGSSRYMIYDYMDFYAEAGIDGTLAPLLDSSYLSEYGAPASFSRSRNVASRPIYYLRAVAKRLAQMKSAGRYDLVVLEKEMFPYFPYGIEKGLKRSGAKLVTLFDDAIHVYYALHPNALIRTMCRNKVEHIVRVSDSVIVWNKYLYKYMRQYNDRVTLVNTGVDLRRYHLRHESDSKPQGNAVIGWIGSASSFEYLRSLEPVFRRLRTRNDCELRVVSSRDYASDGLKVTNRRWSLESEVQDLCSFDIGIMPLPDDPWTRGKSGCKAIQYMAVGVPAVCSPVGIATEIIKDGRNGFLAATEDEWFAKLAVLIENAQLRKAMGRAGRRLVEQTFSIQAVAPKLIAALKRTAAET